MRRIEKNSKKFLDRKGDNLALSGTMSFKVDVDAPFKNSPRNITNSCFVALISIILP